MCVKLQPRPRARACSLLLSALAIACAPEDEDDADNGGFGQTPGTIQSDAAVLADSGLPPAQPAAPDAGSTFVPPAVVPDGGVVMPADAGPVIPPVIVDAGLMADAGPVVSDAGATGDAGASGDAGGDACPTYDNFGRMFMSTYCTSCHMGAAAPRMVRLDTLANITAQKAAIKRAAVTGTAMPPSGSRPSAADRMKLGQWLDCGPM